MATASAPPMIAPGIICPKCKGAMLDERQTKRSDKSPDYTCANMLCVEIKNGKSYRTAIWAEKGNGSGAESSASAGGNAGNSTSAAPADPPSERLKLTDIYMKSSQFVIDKIVPLYAQAEIGVSDQAVAAMVATLFIAATKER